MLPYVYHIYGNFVSFLLYAERNNPVTANIAPIMEIHVIGSFKINTDVIIVMTGTT